MRVLSVFLVIIGVALAQSATGSLSGTVTDITRAGAKGVSAIVVSEDGKTRLESVSDAKGLYRFDGLSPGVYRLELGAPGFRILRLRSIQIEEGERASLPKLMLELGMFDCRERASLDYVRVIKSEFGNVGGRVILDDGRIDGSRLEESIVELLCDKGKPCRSTKTDSKGEFLFTEVAPEVFAIRASHSGYYTETEPEYVVRAGLESIYYPVHLEPCHLGDCRQARPEKPLRLCE